MWLEERKDEKAGHEGLLTPEWPRGHSWHGMAAVLQSVTKVKVTNGIQS